MGVAVSQYYMGISLGTAICVPVLDVFVRGFKKKAGSDVFVWEQLFIRGSPYPQDDVMSVLLGVTDPERLSLYGYRSMAAYAYRSVAIYSSVPWLSAYGYVPLDRGATWRHGP
eukprot:3292309-Rhodomonas_salina.6